MYGYIYGTVAGQISLTIIFNAIQPWACTNFKVTCTVTCSSLFNVATELSDHNPLQVCWFIYQSILLLLALLLTVFTSHATCSQSLGSRSTTCKFAYFFYCFFTSATFQSSSIATCLCDIFLLICWNSNRGCTPTYFFIETLLRENKMQDTCTPCLCTFLSYHPYTYLPHIKYFPIISWQPYPDGAGSPTASCLVYSMISSQFLVYTSLLFQFYTIYTLNYRQKKITEHERQEAIKAKQE